MKGQMLLFASVGLALAAVTFLVAVVCFSNFNKGLKPILLGQIQPNPPVNQSEDTYFLQRLHHPIPPHDRASRRFDLD